VKPETANRPTKVTHSLLFVSVIALLGGCAAVLQARSEVPVNESQIAGLPEGIERPQLLQRLGPPAEESAYKNLNETVLSWRLLEPGNQHWLFNAHLDSSGRVRQYSRSPDPAASGNGSSVGAM
jgi:hypothetical protein